jgi:hypothetical protein
MFTRLGTYTSNPNVLAPFVTVPGDIDDMVCGGFLLNITGFTVATQVPVAYKYAKSYGLAFMFLPLIAGTGNGSGQVVATPLTGNLITAANLPFQEHGLLGMNNGANLEVCSLEILANNNTFNFLNTGSINGWTGTIAIYPQIVKLFLS